MDEGPRFKPGAGARALAQLQGRVRRPATLHITVYDELAPIHPSHYASAAREAVARSITRAEQAEKLVRYDNAEEPAHWPFYSRLMSARSLVAVYKANSATCNAYADLNGMHSWRALSYATDRGIVFG